MIITADDTVNVSSVLYAGPTKETIFDIFR